MVNTIDKINISSDGNASDFGDLLAAGQNISGCCNGSRAIMMAGKSSSSNQTNVIQYVELPSNGNTQDFGDLNQSTQEGSGQLQNSTRSLHAGVKLLVVLLMLLINLIWHPQVTPQTLVTIRLRDLNMIQLLTLQKV